MQFPQETHTRLTLSWAQRMDLEKYKHPSTTDTGGICCDRVHTRYYRRYCGRAGVVVRISLLRELRRISVVIPS